jgi:hypothetical protein
MLTKAVARSVLETFNFLENRQNKTEKNLISSLMNCKQEELSFGIPQLISFHRQPKRTSIRNA